MDPMVLKYLVLAGVTYGLHLLLSITQILLCLYLITSGILHLAPNKVLGKWLKSFGFLINQNVRQKQWIVWLCFISGIALILPLMGLSYWIAIAACPASVYCLYALQTAREVTEGKRKQGNLARGLLVFTAVLVCSFTVWEGQDLIRAGFRVTFKALYWEYVEVMGWQKQNNPNAPGIGDMAPDFELVDYKGENKVRLSDFRGEKPVVLVFGSFT